MDYNNPRFRPTVDRAIKVLKDRLGDNLLKIYVFGSLARNEGNIASDVDLLASLKNMISRKERFELYDILCDEEGYVPIDLKFMIEDELNTYSEVFNKVVKQERIAVYEK